jgi:ribosomal protein S17E
MDIKQEIVRKKYDVNKHLIDKVWTDESKGLRKEVITFRYYSVVKASELSKCLVEIIDLNNFDSIKHPSNYVDENKLGNEFWIEIGHSLTPVDCYIEEFLKKMFIDETSNCFIKTKSDEIMLTIRLKRIEFGGYYAEQSIDKMFDLAKLYKENGVKMFKDYPKFAHQYFNLAAKCLLAFNPHGETDACEQSKTVTRKDINELLQTIYMNIAACLIKQNRFEEILYILNFVKTQDKPSEKAVYRLALAYFHVKDYESAKTLIERLDFKQNKELVQLMGKIHDNWKVEHDKYSNMVKKMFA